MSWGHGTNGMADTCAPSLYPDDAVPLVNMLLDKGWVVTASDYQGEGTPGLLPYIAGDERGPQHDRHRARGAEPAELATRATTTSCGATAKAARPRCSR